MAAPATQPISVSMDQWKAGSSCRMMMPTETKAVSVARKVPAALRNSAASIASLSGWKRSCGVYFAPEAFCVAQAILSLSCSVPAKQLPC
jgi:hypothetical protein